MMKSKAMGLALLAGLVVAMPAVAETSAVEKGVNKAAVAAAPGPSAEVVAQRTLAYQIAGWGKANNNAQALLLAARMLQDAPASSDGAAGTNTPLKDAPAAGTAPASLRAPVTAQSLLNDAKALANGDRYVMQQAAMLEGNASKGVVSGAIDIVRDIPARTVHSITFTARAGERLSVRAIGDGDTDVDVVLKDENGRVVCNDDDPDTWGGCDVTPAWTGRFTMDVINNGSVWTRTHIITN